MRAPLPPESPLGLDPGARIAGSTSVNALCGRGESSIGTLPLRHPKALSPAAPGRVVKVRTGFWGYVPNRFAQAALDLAVRGAGGRSASSGGRTGETDAHAGRCASRGRRPPQERIFVAREIVATLEQVSALRDAPPRDHRGAPGSRFIDARRPRAASMSIPGTFRGMVAAGWMGLGF